MAGVDLATLAIRVTQDGVSQAQSGLDSLTRSGANAEKSVGSLASATGKMVSVLATIAAAAGGIYAVQRAFQAGIKAVDDFKLATIGVAATIADMAKDQSAGQQNYTRALAYSKDMYQELELAAARYFASGQEMTQAWNILAQKGVVLRKDEIDSLGVIVDRIKLSTQGQASGIQIAQEMRAMLTGQARATDQIGMLLKDRIPNLEQEIAKHRQIGDLVKWLGDQFKGLKYASVDIQDTLESQKSTLGTLLTQVGRGGLAGAYTDIVDLLKQVNDYLTIHKDEISGGIAKGWQAVKELAGGVYGFIQAIANIANKGIVVPINFVIGGAAKFLAGGAGPMGDFGFGAMDTSTPELNIEAKLKQNQEMAKQVEQYKRETFELYAKGLGAPAVNVPGGKEPKGGGGGGTDAEINRLNSLFDTLTKDIARLSEGKLAEIKANAAKTNEQIFKKTSDRAHSEAEVAILNKQRETLQKGKLQDDFDLKMAKDSGDVFLAIKKDYEKDLSDYKGLAGAKELTEANRAKKELDARMKFQEQLMGMQSASLSALASTVPLLSQQLPIEKTLLDIELKRGDLKMEEELRVLRINHMISAGQEDEMRQLKGLENQYKKYAQERKGWMLEGVSGGLGAGSVDRGKEAETRTAQWTIDAMKGAETWLGETGGQAFVDYLHGKKADLTKMFQDMGDSLIKQLFKMGTTKLFDSVWDGIGKALGVDKTGKLGTRTNPMWVTSEGAGAKGIGGLGGGGTPDFATKASKIGMTVGTGGGAGGANLGGWSDDIKGLKTYDKLYDQMIKGQTKDWKMTDKLSDNFWKDNKKDATTYSKMQDDMIGQNQELFKADYLTTYQDSFTGMATGITGVWGTAQGLMTAAGVQGESQRYATMASYGIQAVTLLYNIVAKGTLAKAWSAGASAYASTWEFLGFPLAVAVAPIMAAVAFAGTLMAGSGMGGGGGGSATTQSYAASGSAGGSIASAENARYHSGGHLQPYYAHGGFPPLKPGEVPFIGLDTERVLSPKQTYDYEAGMRAAGGSRPGENGGNNGGGGRPVLIEFSTPPIFLDGKEIYAAQKHIVRADIQKQIKMKRLRTG